MKIRIGIGLGSSQTSLEALRTVVAAMTDVGFDSLWISELLTGPGPDPLIALATAAQLDPKLKVGTTMLLPGRNELRLAKSLATLDVLSEGRLLITFVPGLAHGSERAAVGVAVSDRAAAIEQTLPRLRRWWAGEEVDGVILAPLPVQTPLEPWLGGLAPRSLRMCGQLADGWLGAFCTPDEAAHAQNAINAAATEAGRRIDPEHFGLSIGYTHEALGERQLATLRARLNGRDVDPNVLVPVGYAAVRETLQALIAVGLSKFVLRPTFTPESWPEELNRLAAAVGDLQT